MDSGYKYICYHFTVVVFPWYIHYQLQLVWPIIRTHFQFCGYAFSRKTTFDLWCHLAEIHFIPTNYTVCSICNVMFLFILHIYISCQYEVCHTGQGMQQDKMIHDGAICAISCFIHGILSIAAMYIMFKFYIATSKGRQPIMAKVIWLQVFQVFFVVILVYNIMFHCSYFLKCQWFTILNWVEYLEVIISYIPCNVKCCLQKCAKSTK